MESENTPSLPLGPPRNDVPSWARVLGLGISSLVAIGALFAFDSTAWSKSASMQLTGDPDELSFLALGLMIPLVLLHVFAFPVWAAMRSCDSGRGALIAQLVFAALLWCFMFSGAFVWAMNHTTLAAWWILWAVEPIAAGALARSRATDRASPESS